VLANEPEEKKKKEQMYIKLIFAKRKHTRAHTWYKHRDQTKRTNLLDTNENHHKTNTTHRLTNGPDDSLLQLPLFVCFDNLGADVGAAVV